MGVGYSCCRGPIDIFYLFSYVYLRGLVLDCILIVFIIITFSKAYPLIASDIIVAVSAVDIKTNLVSTNPCFEQDLKYSWTRLLNCLTPI